MKVVLDTNVLLSAMATRGICEAVLDFCIDSSECVLILSEHILSEFSRHYRDKFGMTADETRSVIAFLREHAKIVEPVAVSPNSCRDADDLPVLGTAIAGRADCLVTGDKDMIALGQFDGIAILTPRAFFDRTR